MGPEPIVDPRGVAAPKEAAAPNGCCKLPSEGGTVIAEGVA